MPFVATIKQSFGRSVLSDQITATGTAQNFVYQQTDFWTGQVTAVASQVTILSLRTTPNTQQAANLYGYPVISGDYRTYAVAWQGTQVATAVALAALVNAGETMVTMTSTGGGAFTLETQKSSTPYYGLQIEIQQQAQITLVHTNEALDLVTWPNPVILKGTVDGGNIRYLEHGTPTSSVGEIVTDGNPFEIVGAANIIAATFIQETATASVNYDIAI